VTSDRLRSCAGTNPAVAAYRKRVEIPEASMKIARIVLASAAALTILSSVTLAQQPMTGTGTVTTVDRISGNIAIQQTQSGTVGANSGGVVNVFKLQGGSLDAWHAGDKVTFSATETGGVKTITKIEKQ
jgi:Cu/Ag efflux protein CusF